MNKFFYYNSLCTGANTPSIFSIDPYVTAVKELLVLELKQVVYYIEKLRALDFDMTSYTDKVIEFIAVLIINLDFTKENTFIIIEDLYNNKKMLEKMYISACEKSNETPDLLPSNSISLSSKEVIIKALNDKEKNIKTKNADKNISKNRKYLYEIMLNIVLNACSNLIELKSCGINPSEQKNKVLDFLNKTNIPMLTDSELKSAVKDFTLNSYETEKILYKALEEKFGPVIETKVDFCSKKGGAVLVSGSCCLELAKILEQVKGLNINVYSYHEMISAFQYEKFKNHPNFAGHYYKTGSNMLSDFAGFPGPVFISKNSLPKIDVIRGRIFTSAKYPAFGISKIENDNFEPLIQCALDMKGFEREETIKTVTIGFNKSDINSKINTAVDKFNNKEIKNIIIIGLADRFNVSDSYTQKFIDIIDSESFIISFAYNAKRPNFMYVNSYLDYGILYEIIEMLINKNEKIKNCLSVILADCSSDTIAHVFNFIHLDVKNIFLGKCCPNIVNPQLIDSLSEMFNIRQISAPEIDLDIIKNSASIE